MRGRLSRTLVCHSVFLGGLAVSTCGFALATQLFGQQGDQSAAESKPSPASATKATAEPPATTDSQTTESRTDKTSPPGLVRLAKDYDLWIDPKRKLVVVDGSVCLREGQLEMFACPRGTKEHEAIIAINCKPQFVHAALLAVGAKPGAPVQWEPYQSARGTTVEIMLLWVDEKGVKHKARAQDWVKDTGTGKAMTRTWVFAGSRVWTDPDTKQTYYLADGGDFICVSNFPEAMLDLPVKSSQSNAELMFTAFTENIPPLKTKVRLVLIPQLDKPGVAVKVEAGTPQQPAGGIKSPTPKSEKPAKGGEHPTQPAADSP